MVTDFWKCVCFSLTSTMYQRSCLWFLIFPFTIWLRSNLRKIWGNTVTGLQRFSQKCYLHKIVVHTFKKSLRYDFFFFFIFLWKFCKVYVSFNFSPNIQFILLSRVAAKFCPLRCLRKMRWAVHFFCIPLLTPFLIFLFACIFKK